MHMQALSAMVEQLRPVSAPHRAAETMLWRGHLSHWIYFWRWFWGIALLPAFGLGLLIILGIYFDRARRVYVVTSRKVVVQSGLLIKSTNEIRIKDIRSVNVTKRGITGLLGIGSIEFSSAATDRAEIIFSDVAEVDKIRDLVRKLQGEA
jgi:uncharacterized membrane protein YdbT with pleckstrin-like domain